MAQITTCRLFGDKPLSEPMLFYWQLEPTKYNSIQFYLKFKRCRSRKCTWKCRLQKWRPSCVSLNVSTHSGLDKIATISQTTISNAFSWMKMYEFRLRFRRSLKLVPKVPISNVLILVQIMAWLRPGEKPLSKPMMVSLLTHISDTWPQWVKSYMLMVIWNGMNYCSRSFATHHSVIWNFE